MDKACASFMTRAKSHVNDRHVYFKPMWIAQASSFTSNSLYQAGTTFPNTTPYTCGAFDSRTLQTNRRWIFWLTTRPYGPWPLPLFTKAAGKSSVSSRGSNSTDLRIKKFLCNNGNAVKKQICCAVTPSHSSPLLRKKFNWTPRSILCYKSSRPRHLKKPIFLALGLHHDQNSIDNDDNGN